MTGKVVQIARKGRAAALDAGKGAGEAPELTAAGGSGGAGAHVGEPESGTFLDAGAPPSSSVAVSNTATESKIVESAPQIDWLTVAQVHDKPIPRVGSTLMLFCDVESGEIESQAIKGLQFDGSYDSRLQVRCDGRRVEVSGNPSRFGRRDNLWGLTDIWECIALYNSVLRQLELPEFYDDIRKIQLQGHGHGRRSKPKNPLANMDTSGIDPAHWNAIDPVTGVSQHWLRRESGEAIAKETSSGGVTQLAEYGCRIKRIDLCVAYQVGSLEDARRSIRALGTVSHAGKPGLVYPDGNTVSWGHGSRYTYSKYYIKGPEMQKHLPQSDEYCRELTKWANDVGLVRHEVSLKSMMLSKNGLDQPSRWTVETALQIMKAYSAHEKAGVGSGSYERIAEELVAMGVSVSRARKAQQAAYAFLAGHEFIIGHNIGKSSYYNLQADLRKVGLNIGAPLNVSSLRHSVRVIEWQPAQPPAFYRRVG